MACRGGVAVELWGAMAMPGAPSNGVPVCGGAGGRPVPVTASQDDVTGLLMVGCKGNRVSPIFPRSLPIRVIGIATPSAR